MTLIVEDSLTNIATTASTGSDGQTGFQFTTEEISTEGDLDLYLCLAAGTLNEGISAANVKAGGITGQVGSQRTAGPANAGEPYTHTTGMAPSGLFTDLAPGNYTLYLAAEDTGIPLLELYPHTFEIEDLGGGGVAGEVEVVDSASNSVLDYQATASLTTETTLEGEDAGTDAAILVLLGSFNYELSCTFNGVEVPRIDTGAWTGGVGHLHYLENPPIGTHTLRVFDGDEQAEDVSFVALSVKGVSGRRTSQVANATLTSGGATNAEAGDLVVALGYRGGATNLTIGSPFDRLAFAGGSFRMSFGLAVAQSETNGGPSGATWTATGGSGAGASGGIALIPMQVEPPEEDPPTGTVSCDLAVGHESFAIREVVYDGNDTGTAGFKLQYRINGGSPVDYTPPVLITGQTPGDPSDSVEMRAVNTAGNGDWSDPIVRRLHLDWHRGGIKRFNPSAAVGHAAVGYDTSSGLAFQGPLTAGGRDRAVLATFDIGYGVTLPSSQVVPHDISYDGAPSVRVLQALSNGSPAVHFRHGSGGSEAHVITGVPSGQHTLRYESVANPTDRSLWLAASALELVHQESPVAATKWGMYAGEGTEPNDIQPVSEVLTLADVPCSYDETIFSFVGFYHYQTDLGSSEPTSMMGETSGWTAGFNNFPPTTNVGIPDEDYLIRYVGNGAGAEDAIVKGWVPVHPGDGPLVDIPWYRVTYTWSTVAAIVMRPSPNMLHDLSIDTTTEDGCEWSVQTDVNHGRLLVAVTPFSDDPPTAEQIRDEIDDSSSDYSGTFEQLDDWYIDEEDTSTLADLIEGLDEGEYRLSVVYESWQGNLGAALHQTWGTLTAEPPTISAVKTYPSAVFPVHDGNSTTEAQVGSGEWTHVGTDGGVGGLDAGTEYNGENSIRLRQNGGEPGDRFNFSTRAASAPLVIRMTPEPPAVPQGVIDDLDATVDEDDVTLTWTYDLDDVIGFEAQVDDESPIDVGDGL